MADKSIYQNAPEDCHYYFDLTSSNDLIAELKKSAELTKELFAQISTEKENFAYRPGKWTTKEILRHLIDCERIYCYRAFRFSRFDTTELPGFDEDKYIENIDSNALQLSELTIEFEIVRKSSIALYSSMTNEMLDFAGMANGAHFTARAIGFLTAGHNLHHLNFIQKNYL